MVPLLVLAILFVLNALSLDAQAASYVTHLNRVADSERPRPAYDAANPLSAAYVDERFGTTIVRVTGDPDQWPHR